MNRILLLAILLLYGCVTVYGGQEVRQTSRSDRKGRVLKPEDFPIQSNYSDEEKSIPMLLAATPDSNPEAFALSVVVPPGNQGKQASGVAWAAGYLAATHYFRAHGQRDYVCSPAFIYNSLNNGKDEGIEVLNALDFLETTGCADYRFMPFNEKDFFRRPGADALSSAEQHRVRGFGRIDYRDIDQMRSHLLQGSVVILTMKITENFVDLSDALWVPSGDFIAIHTVALVGYDIKREEVLIQNSAGPKWGKDGRARMPLAWFLRLTEKAFVLF